jgi:hypothetical protein
MRIGLTLVPLALCAAPALAQPLPPPAPPPPLPQVLADPATVDRLTSVMQSLSQSLLDLPVGNVRAEIEGRPPSAADRHRTVGSETGLSARELNRRIAAAKPQIEQSIRAMNQALPEITQDLQQAQRSVERAISNLPDPNYPRR